MLRRPENPCFILEPDNLREVLVADTQEDNMWRVVDRDETELAMVICEVRGRFRHGTQVTNRITLFCPMQWL